MSHDDETMPAVHAVIADFPFDGYGIDLDGADPAWLGDLAAAITGALPDSTDPYAATRGEPGDGAA